MRGGGAIFHQSVISLSWAYSNIGVSIQAARDRQRSRDPFSIWRKQAAQLSQRDRAAGCVTVFAKSRRLELGDNILRTL